MHAFFNDLESYDIALLAIAVTISGKEAPQLLTGLNQPYKERLQQKVDTLLQLDSEPRIGLLVKTLKSLLQARDLRGLERVDPAWIVRWLEHESPRLIAACLITLPLHLQHSVVRRLPPSIQQVLPSKPKIEALPTELLHYLRRWLERKITAMPAMGEPPYGIESIIHLDRADIPILIRDLGLVELGHTFAKIGKVALAELLRRLPAAFGDELIAAIRTAEPEQLPDIKQAEQTLNHVQENFENPNDLCFRAGLWRLSKGIHRQPETILRQLFQRITPPASELLETNLTQLASLPPLEEEIVKQLQDHIMGRILLLRQKEQIHIPWGRSDIRWHYAASSQQAAAQLEERE